MILASSTITQKPISHLTTNMTILISSFPVFSDPLATQITQTHFGHLHVFGWVLLYHKHKPIMILSFLYSQKTTLTHHSLSLSLTMPYKQQPLSFFPKTRIQILPRLFGRNGIFFSIQFKLTEKKQNCLFPFHPEKQKWIILPFHPEKQQTYQTFIHSLFKTLVP